MDDSVYRFDYPIVKDAVHETGSAPGTLTASYPWGEKPDKELRPFRVKGNIASEKLVGHPDFGFRGICHIFWCPHRRR
jgi:hypothetical protein